MKYPTRPSILWYVDWRLEVWMTEPYKYNYLWRALANQSIGSFGEPHPYWGA